MTSDTPATARQDKPVRMKGGMPDVPTLVAFDLHVRAEAGKEKYGERLTPFNGRDALVDAYQEALDIVQYLRQALYERDGK